VQGDDGRQRQAARQDRGVRGRAADIGDKAGELMFLEHQHVGRRQIVRDHDGIRRQPRQRTMIVPQEVAHNAAGDVLHVGGSLKALTVTLLPFIYEGERTLYIHPDECVDCGACEPVCPVEAIFYEDDTPEQWKDFYKANVEFFDDLGSPGGAAKLGKIPKDHPLVAALPPQSHEE